MYIAICEDTPQDLDFLKAAVKDIVRNQDLRFQIMTFTDGDAFLRYMEDHGAPAISFLDIYLGSVNGLDIGKKIRQESERAAIVLSTKSSEHMAQGWDIGAVHYLVKPYSEEKVVQAMQRALLTVSKPERYLIFSVNRRKKKLLFSQIIYIESRNKYCHIFTESEEYKVLAKLSDLEKQLDDSRFLRCHQSYIVNMDWVEKAGKHEFMLKNGASVPVRRRERGVVMTEYEEYVFKKVRESL